MTTLLLAKKRLACLAVSKILPGVLVMALYACGGGQSPSFNDSPTASGQSSQAIGEAQSSQAAGAEQSSPPATSLASSSLSVVAEKTAPEIYTEQCASCHGDKGQGGAAGGNLKTCSTCGNASTLANRIELTMPLGAPDRCDANCSALLTTYILNDFVEVPRSSTSSLASSANSLTPASSIASSIIGIPVPVSSAAANSSYSVKNSSTGPLNSSKASSSLPASSVANISSLASTSRSSTSSLADQAGNTARGKDLYENGGFNCLACHGVKGDGPVAKIDGSKTSYRHSTSDTTQTLATYISAWMPPGAESSCTGNCSNDIAAYIQTWVASSSLSSADSSLGFSSASSSAVVASSTASVNSSRTTSASSAAVVRSSVAPSSSSSAPLGSSAAAVSSRSLSSALSSSISSTMSAASSSSISSASSRSSALGGIVFQDNFETGQVNSQPVGWNNFLGYNYNAANNPGASNYALVDSSRSYNGSNSVRFTGSLAQILRPLPVGTQRLHLRAYVNMSKKMGNDPGDNHEHIMGIKKTTDANNEIRVGQIKGVLGTNEVPSDNIAPTSDRWGTGTELAPDTWYCIETAMYADTAYDELYMWVDGQLVHSITSANDWNNGALGADWLSDKFNHVMFGFHSFSGNTADVWMDDIVVSTQPIGCGTGSSSSSAATSASSAPASSSVRSSASQSSSSAMVPVSSSSSIAPVNSSSSSSAMIVPGNAAAGKTLYDNGGFNCVTCHGSTGAGLYKLDANKTAYQHSTSTSAQTLSAYINTWMPQGAAATCTGQCGEDIAAYIRTWVAGSSSSIANPGSSSSSNSSSTPANCDLAYGARSLRVLTKNEYINTIRDLTGLDLALDLGQSTVDALPADNLVNGFSNNVMASIESGPLQSYNLVAAKIVDSLAAENFSGIVDCTAASGEECATRLIDGFGRKAFRRPFTEDERLAFLPLFTAEFTGGEIKEGIKLALRTMLTSPQFLYRSEVGISIVDIENGTGDEPQYEPTGSVASIVSIATAPSYHYGVSASYTFTGVDLLELTTKAEQNAQGNWPSLEIQIDNKVITTLAVNHSYNKTYRLPLTAITGQNKYVAFRVPNGDASLLINNVKLSGAKLVVAEKPPVALDRDAFVLTPYELAAFLSYTFAGTTPDEVLLTAAAQGGLSTNAQIETQVERLIATTQARVHFGNFAAQWLRTDRIMNVTKDTTLYPGFTGAVRAAMAQEVRELFNHVVLDEGEAFSKLYDGNFTFVNQVLAGFYGIPGVTGNTLRKVTNVNSRAGLVTSGAFLAVNAHEQETAPILRSTYARRNFLCHDVPAPPTGISLGGVDVDAVREEQRIAWEQYLAANNGKATSRRKYEFQTSATLCQTCHEKMINPLGGGFEDYNAVGLPQVSDFNNLAIDASGVLYGVSSPDDGQTIAFQGAMELAHQIAGLDATRQCFIDNSFRLAMGTGSSYFDREKPGITLSAAEKQSYSCEVAKLDAVMKSSDYSTRTLLKTLGSLDSVRYRKNVTR